MASAASVEHYLAALPPDRRLAMETLRATIKATVPGAAELISYQMPAFKTHGQFLVSYASFKAHYSLFPASDEVVKGIGEELTPYLFGRGTIRFPVSEPIPVDLVRRILEIRAAENAASARERG